MKKNIIFFILFLTFSISVFSQNLNEKKVLIMWGGWEGHKPELFVKYVSAWLEKKDIEYVISNDLEDYANFNFLSEFDLIVH